VIATTPQSTLSPRAPPHARTQPDAPPPDHHAAASIRALELRLRAYPLVWEIYDSGAAHCSLGARMISYVRAGSRASGPAHHTLVLRQATTREQQCLQSSVVRARLEPVLRYESHCILRSTIRARSGSSLYFSLSLPLYLSLSLPLSLFICVSRVLSFARSLAHAHFFSVSRSLSLCLYMYTHRFLSIFLSFSRGRARVQPRHLLARHSEVVLSHCHSAFGTVRPRPVSGRS